MAGAIMSAGSDCWGTPLNLFQELHRRFQFTIDAAADESNALLPEWFGPGSFDCQDGLMARWAGERIYCNPPFSRVDDFLKKAHDTIRDGYPGTLIVMLIKAAPDKISWHEHVMKGAAAVGFFRGRLTYRRPEGEAVGATFPSALVTYYEPRLPYPMPERPVFYALDRNGAPILGG